MPIKWQHEHEGVVVFRVSGLLTRSELSGAQSEAESIIQNGHSRLLVIMKNFLGWKKEANWADMSFAEKNDPYISKMAIVGDEQWRDMANTFTLRGLRAFPIEYFASDQEAQARTWLAD